MPTMRKLQTGCIIHAVDITALHYGCFGGDGGWNGYFCAVFLVGIDAGVGEILIFTKT